MTDRTATTSITMPPAEGTSPTASTADYQAVIQFGAPPEAVFEALTTVAGLAGWWMPVSGAGSEGGELRFDSGYEDPLIIHVDQARRPMAVAWSVRACAFLPDWVGTQPVFTLSPIGTGGCELRFRHHGLTAQLECFTTCRAGWDQYLGSLHEYVETGRGRPQGSDAGG